MISKDKLVVVIRSVNERTLTICKHFIKLQEPEVDIHIVNEYPFELALKKCYQIGLDCKSEWMMTLDADVILRNHAISDLLSEAEKLPKNYFQIEGLVHDKLTGKFREAGHRMYRTRFLAIALEQIPKDREQIRPERTTLNRMIDLGYPSTESKTVFGVHDYLQYHHDIYRKAYVHAQKHQQFLPEIIKRWSTLKSDDDDFLIALQGFYDSLISQGEARIDSRDYVVGAQMALENFKIQEKQDLDENSIDFEWVDKALADAGRPPITINPKSIDAKLARLNKRFLALGPLKIAPYLFGALLCDIGNMIIRKTLNGQKIDN